MRFNISSPALVPLLLLLIVSFKPIFCWGFATRDRPDRDNVDCYSCMSMAYFKMWNVLMMKYYPPINYTDACEYPDDYVRPPVGTVSCKGVCLSLIEKVYVDGSMTRRYTRGCVHRLLLHGLDPLWLQQSGLNEYDGCRLAERRQFFPNTSVSKENRLFPADISHDLVTVCSCLGSRCNGGLLSTSYAPPKEMTNIGSIMAVYIVPIVLVAFMQYTQQYCY